MRVRALLVLSLLSINLLTSCKTPEKPANSDVAVRPNDALSRYSLSTLKSALDARRSQAIHPHGGDALDQASDRDVINEVIAREKAIYPHDIRKDFYEFQYNLDYLSDSQSVAALVKPEHYHESEKGLELVYKSLGETETLCSDQSFFGQPEAAYCSGFVIGPDLIATAGHCVPSNWKSVRLVFGYRMVRDQENIHLETIRKEDVYSIKAIRAQKVDDKGQDFAILQMDRPIGVEHPPLRRRASGGVQAHEGVYTLGYPMGIPIKLADQASVLHISTNGFFQADLDTYGGNSGSPVLNASSHLVEGILVRGSNDYRYVSEDRCYRALVCPTVNGCQGEDVTTIDALNETGSQQGISLSQPTDTQIEKSVAMTNHQPITRQYSSGPVVSGSGGNFSGDYTVSSDPAPDGYKIGPFSSSLTGDRACGAWSTCSTQVENGVVVFRFRLQGHNEWGGSGQAYSTGTLKVTYVPN